MLKVDGVHSVNDLHIWCLAGGKNVLTAHLFLHRVHKSTNYRGLIHKIHHELEMRLKKYDICHSTY